MDSRNCRQRINIDADKYGIIKTQSLMIKSNKYHMVAGKYQMWNFQWNPEGSDCFYWLSGTISLESSRNLKDRLLLYQCAVVVSCCIQQQASAHSFFQVYGSHFYASVDLIF